MTETVFFRLLPTMKLVEVGTKVATARTQSFAACLPRNFCRNFTSIPARSSGATTDCTFSGDRVSDVFKNLKVGPMKRLYKYYTPDAVNIAGGVPMDSTFPITNIDVNLDDGTTYSLPKEQSLFLNYQRGDGIPTLKGWIDEHVKAIHQPPNASACSCVTVGSTDAFSKTMTLLQSDSVIFDQYSYGHAVATSQQLGKQSIGVAVDADGILPDALRSSVLAARARGLSANILYLVPTGQNPTGTTMPFSRIQAVYDVCQELDIVVVEDDAYYYLYFGKEPTVSEAPGDAMPGLAGLPRSFLSIDTDGRVIRLDSLSKFVAPGMRLGWITASNSFIDKYQLLQEASTQFPSGVAQSVFTGLINHWGPTGLDKHVRKTQAHYQRQRDATVGALKACFGPEEASYVLPDCGMFIWLTFNNIALSPFELFEMFAAAGVIVVPSSDFYVASNSSSNSASTNCSVASGDGNPAVRITFAAATPDQIRAGVQRMAAALRAYKAGI